MSLCKGENEQSLSTSGWAGSTATTDTLWVVGKTYKNKTVQAGGPSSPLTANIYKEHREELLPPTCVNSTLVTVHDLTERMNYIRTYVYTQHSRWLHQSKYLNIRTITIEEEKSRKLAFLDVQVLGAQWDRPHLASKPRPTKTHWD